MSGDYWASKPIVGLTRSDMDARSGGTMVLDVAPKPAIRRQRQRDCRHEPPYPGEETVVMSIADPDRVVHADNGRCFVAYPHPIAECQEFVLTNRDEYEEAHRWERRL